MSNTIAVKYPKLMKRSTDYKVKFNGYDADVLQACVASFANVIADGTIQVEIEYSADIKENAVYVSPKRKNIHPQISGHKMSFTMDKPEDLIVFVNGVTMENPLMIFGNTPEEKPSPDDENITFYKSGQVYEVGKLMLEDNQTLYIEEGAVVRGNIWALQKKNIAIKGRGVLDSSYFTRGEGKAEHSIRFDSCEDFVLKDFTVMDAQTWIIVLGNCINGILDGTREFGRNVGTDGCDICGSSNIRMTNAFVFSNDDAVVIKAFDDIRKKDAYRKHWNKPVENILVDNCIFMNYGAGNGIEIGHELRTEYVKNVVFRNIDIVCKHGHGAALSIHNCDRASVSDIIFDDIRIEHCYDKFVDIRVMRSQFGHDEVRGSIKNVLLKDINLVYNNCNLGYTVSMITGYDPEHLTEDITFQDFRINGEVVLKPEDIELAVRDVKNIRFVDTEKNKEITMNYVREGLISE